MQALAFLARRLRADRVLVLFAARDPLPETTAMDLERLPHRVGGHVSYTAIASYENGNKVKDVTGDLTVTK